jgi:hypothetical protein
MVFRSSRYAVSGVAVSRSFRDTARRYSLPEMKGSSMSCRIDRVVGGDDLVVLGISGNLAGEQMDTIRNLLRQEVGVLAIDLKNVSLVDREAVQFLR